MTYDDLLTALDDGRIVIITLGTDLDGDRVLCTSFFDAEAACDVDTDEDAWFYHSDKARRAGYMIGMIRAVVEELRERHGIRCA